MLGYLCIIKPLTIKLTINQRREKAFNLVKSHDIRDWMGEWVCYHFSSVCFCYRNNSGKISSHLTCKPSPFLCQGGVQSLKSQVHRHVPPTKQTQTCKIILKQIIEFVPFSPRYNCFLYSLLCCFSHT